MPATVVVLTALVFSYHASSGIFLGTLISNYIALDHQYMYKIVGLALIPAFAGVLSVFIARKTNKNIRNFFSLSPIRSDIDGLDVFYFCLLYASINSALLLAYNICDQATPNIEMLVGVLTGLFGQLTGSFLGFVVLNFGYSVSKKLLPSRG